MMKNKRIAVITSGLLPLPAIKGGAIETLLQYLIDYNESSNDFSFDIYSIYNDEAASEAKKYKNTNYIYIKINNFVNNIYYNCCRVIRKLGYKDPNFQKMFLNNVCKKLKSNNYDLVFIESDNHFVLPVKKVNKAPIILYLHNDKLNKLTKNSKQIVDSCKSVVTVSDYIKSRVFTINNSYDSKVTTIYNGIDTTKFNMKNQDMIKKDMRKKYKIAEKDFVFLFSGRIEPAKGVLELIKAFKMINNKKIKLFILGGSFFSSNVKTKYVKKLESEIKDDERIIVTGYIQYSDVPKYYAMSDCMVTPSIWEEPGSLVNQESFAAGVPLITSKSGGTPEYVKNTKSIIIEKNEKFVVNLSNAMKNIIDDKKLQESMKKSALQVKDYFSKERYCKDLMGYLKEQNK